MPLAQQVTEIIVFHLSDGVILNNVTSGNPDPAAQAFLQLTNTVKPQPGFIRQFWGHEVEHPTLFVWAIEWESLEDYTKFAASKSISYITGLGELFDMEVSKPITLLTRVPKPDAATAAFRSGVTEVAFYTFPTRPDESRMDAIEEGSHDVIRDVQAIGKATGAAIGWVIDAVPHTLASGSDSICLYGVFGYASLEVHMQWRETPEAKGYGQHQGSTRPATIVPGVSAETGYFHVTFEEGA